VRDGDKLTRSWSRATWLEMGSAGRLARHGAVLQAHGVEAIPVNKVAEGVRTSST